MKTLVRGWIPCSERMPEPSDTKNLLLYVPKREEVRQNGIFIGNLKPGWKKEDSEGKENIWGIPTDVCDWVLYGYSYFERPVPTHWMPMPEPPCMERGQE